ncbi:MAG: bifunctional nuclease domain-containing protein [Marinilabiliaceae bacterium]|nr:bifunctional nuclease family protein [Bacteroidales bacterium]MDD5815744.1 DUF151 domain-containing protein [Bacteroidales bacterium]MDY4520247.1 bifunctional nuclease domain-containing protein [Bacteroidales bacterium]
MSDDENRLVPLRVVAITDGNAAGTYNLVLQEITGSRRIVMAIGLPEAQSIAVFMEGVSLPRPLMHDLMVQMLNNFEARLSRVIIENLQNGYFISDVVCDMNGRTFIFDARTSDAVALAIRCGSPIFIRKFLLDYVSGNSASSSVAEVLAKPQTSTSLPDMTEDQLRTMLTKAIDAEDYELAQKIKEELTRRG